MNIKDKRGLTLIEVLVALGIFGLVITMATSIFVLAIVNQRRIIALRNVEDNVRFALDSMSREMRTGVNFNGGGSSISFTNAAGEAVVYRLSSGAIQKSSDGGINYSALTGSEATVNYLNFYIIGQAAKDGLQPRITIGVGISSQVGNQSVNAQVETTVSERFLQS